MFTDRSSDSVPGVFAITIPGYNHVIVFDKEDENTVRACNPQIVRKGNIIAVYDSKTKRPITHTLLGVVTSYIARRGHEADLRKSMLVAFSDDKSMREAMPEIRQKRDEMVVQYNGIIYALRNGKPMPTLQDVQANETKKKPNNFLKWMPEFSDMLVKAMDKALKYNLTLGKKEYHRKNPTGAYTGFKTVRRTESKKESFAVVLRGIQFITFRKSPDYVGRIADLYALCLWPTTWTADRLNYPGQYHEYLELLRSNFFWTKPYIGHEWTRKTAEEQKTARIITPAPEKEDPEMNVAPVEEEVVVTEVQTQAPQNTSPTVENIINGRTIQLSLLDLLGPKFENLPIPDSCSNMTGIIHIHAKRSLAEFLNNYQDDEMILVTHDQQMYLVVNDALKKVIDDFDCPGFFGKAKKIEHTDWYILAQYNEPTFEDTLENVWFISKHKFGMAIRQSIQNVYSILQEESVNHDNARKKLTDVQGELDQLKAGLKALCSNI